ncbi:unnamed protein product [Paramecium primaurelia]|uniref:Ribosomal RNA methyltransferase FtsJ domain-containing protein n=1 Tax=Paramecium primaurelia TaxID=5886 RepID=A0A8S1JZY7_PARPR|nr:unnamed protein product [Paramecium primaurelia]
MFIFKLRYYNSSILTELNARFGLLKKGMSVIELGSGSGHWTETLRQVIGSNRDDPKVFAIDEVQLPKRYRDGVIFIQGDVDKKETLMKLQKQLDLKPVDLIISNLETRSQNDRDIDNFEQIRLNRIALNIALKTLKTGGTMLIKAREGLPEEQNYKFINLFFRETIKVRPQTAKLDFLKHYYLGLGFKQRDEYLKYPTFFQKVLNFQDDELLEEEIPPSFQSQAERDLEILEFLQYASKHQIAVTQNQIDEIKQNPRYKNIDWEKYPLFIVPGPLTEYQQQMILIARYNGKLSFTPNTNSVEEDVKKGQEIIEKIEKALINDEKSNELLEEDEILGQDNKEETEELKIMKEQINRIEQEEFQYEMKKEDQEKLNKWLHDSTHKYISDNYKGVTPEKIIQQEIAKGNVTKEELLEYFQMNEKNLIEKANKEYEDQLQRKADKVNQQMTKEHRQEYFNRKKVLKTRRQ